MVTEEELRNMSPEELMEFQKKNCIFCQIVDGKVQAKKVYEDETSIGFLDINPATPGHVLIIPKEHYSIMPQITEEMIGKIFLCASKLSLKAIKSLKATGTNIFVANGIAAGQKAQHFMVHLIPRRDDDAITVFNIIEGEIEEDRFFKIQNAFVKKVNEKFGLNQPTIGDVEEDDELVQTDEGQSNGSLSENQSQNLKKDKGSDDDDVDLDDISSILK